MKCKKIEKWLSDSIDGELSEKKRKKVEDHLQECSLCRSYREQLEKIQKTAKSLDYGRVSPEYWEEFPLKIRARISSLRPKKTERIPFALGWKWAWIGVAVVVVIFIGLSILYFQPKSGQEVYALSYEDSLDRIFREIGDNAELGDIFNIVILASIGESLKETGRESVPDLNDLSFLVEELTEEELMFLDSEIKNEIKS